MHIRIAARKSPLALCQATQVQHKLQNLYPDMRIDIIGMETEGDRILDTPLYKVGGKGLFIKELELALLDNRADIAVHSVKDVTVDIPDGLSMPVILKRADPRDVFVSPHAQTLSALAKKAVIGTSSQRRQAQLINWRDDLIIRDCRGNLATRLNKLDSGQFDAIILAAAGLHRLDMRHRIQQYIPDQIILPAIGQGAIGLECRAQDTKTQAIIQPLNDTNTHIGIQAERAFGKRLAASCQLPIAAHAVLQADELTLTGLVANPNGKEYVRDSYTDSLITHSADHIGITLAEKLLAQGADTILAALST